MHHTRSTTDTTWASLPLTAGHAGDGSGLVLGVALVWRTTCLSTTARASLWAWLAARWGLTDPPVPRPALSYTIPSGLTTLTSFETVASRSQITASEPGNGAPPWAIFNLTNPDYPAAGTNYISSAARTTQYQNANTTRIRVDLQTSTLVMGVQVVNGHYQLGNAGRIGARHVRFAVTTTDPGLGFNTNVGTNQVLWEGELSEVPASEADNPTWQECNAQTAPRTGRYLVVDVFTAWITYPANGMSWFGLRKIKLTVPAV